MKSEPRKSASVGEGVMPPLRWPSGACSKNPTTRGTFSHIVQWPGQPREGARAQVPFRPCCTNTVYGSQPHSSKNGCSPVQASQTLTYFLGLKTGKRQRKKASAGCVYFFFLSGKITFPEISSYNPSAKTRLYEHS